jgi:hypothetical protein
MSSEQDKIAKNGGGAAADTGLGGAGQGGTAQGGAAGGGTEASGNGAGGGTAGGAGGKGTPGGDNGQAGSSFPQSNAPESAVAAVKGCGDPDKVARQLCEAATQEADPFLRAALWDEYNQYKKILARQ